MKITEKRLRATVIELNHMMKRKSLDYGYVISRVDSDYYIAKLFRAAYKAPEKIIEGISASEADAFLRGSLTVVNTLPDVLF